MFVREMENIDMVFFDNSSAGTDVLSSYESMAPIYETYRFEAENAREANAFGNEIIWQQRKQLEQQQKQLHQQEEKLKQQANQLHQQEKQLENHKECFDSPRYKIGTAIFDILRHPFHCRHAIKTIIAVLKRKIRSAMSSGIN